MKKSQEQNPARETRGILDYIKGSYFPAACQPLCGDLYEEMEEFKPKNLPIVSFCASPPEFN